MTDDPRTPKDSDSSTRVPHAVQRLEGPEALLTAEWALPDLPWITAVDETAEDAPLQGERAVPPLPPSRRRPATASTPVAPAEQAPIGGSPSVAADVPDPRAFERAAGAPARAVPLITRPKPKKLEIPIAPSVLVAPDLGATVPPRAEREAAAAPSVERPSPQDRRGRPPLVALATAVSFVLGYGLWSVVVRPAAANVPAERPLPQFLREPPATPPAAAPSAAATAPTPIPLSTLPPELAATLARALPGAKSETTSLAGDAGAAASPPALLEDTPLPSAEPVSTPGSTEVLGAALAPQRLDPAAESPSSKPRPQRPLAARRAERLKTLESQLPGATSRARQSASADALDEHTEARMPRSPVSPALRPLTTYTYEDRALFAVATAPLRVTDLTLETGETLVSQPTAGDAARWVISVVQGGDRSHVFVKPLRPGLRTNLTLTTNRRSYFLELSCSDDGTYMAGVVWRYPADENARRREALAQAARERQSTTAVSDLQALRFDYRIEGTPSWTPTMVFDDGKKTFVRFPRPVSPDRAPALFLLRSGSARDATYVNYRIKGDLYVVDRLVEAAELRLGSDDDQEVVRITRKH